MRSKKTEGARVHPNSARTPVCAQAPFAGGQCTFFFTQKKKVPKKKCANVPLDRLCRTVCRPGKFRPHLTQGLSAQMGCHRGIANSPNHRFFPTECVQQNLNSITRTARRAPYGHRRRLCVGILFSCLCPSPSRSVTPPPRGRLTNPLVLQNRPQGA